MLLVGCLEYVKINYENMLPLSCYQDYRKCRIESALLLLSADYTGPVLGRLEYHL